MKNMNACTKHEIEYGVRLLNPKNDPFYFSPISLTVGDQTYKFLKTDMHFSRKELKQMTTTKDKFSGQIRCYCIRCRYNRSEKN